MAIKIPDIAIINRSSVVSDQDVAAATNAVQKQINDNFAPVWNQIALLVVMTKFDAIPPGFWTMIIADDTDQANALGYHLQDTTPAGFVFAKTDASYGLSWTVTYSHEILEMLADPWVAATALKMDPVTKQPLALISWEVCDPVEADDLGYAIDGIRLSDFVYPAYFQDWNTYSAYDKMGHIAAPFEVARGGYVSGFVPGQGWVSQQTAHQSTRLARRGPYSRTSRRPQALAESLRNHQPLKSRPL